MLARRCARAVSTDPYPPVRTTVCGNSNPTIGSIAHRIETTTSESTETAAFTIWAGKLGNAMPFINASALTTSSNSSWRHCATAVLGYVRIAGDVRVIVDMPNLV